MTPNDKRLKLACYIANITMSAVANLSPVLFLTFRSLYGISYSRLGLLVLINYVTQLSVDLLFSFFSHRFHIPKAVKATPWIAVFGFAVFALCPMFLPQYAYAGIVVGTVIFSAASGLAEALLTPVVAAIPSKDPDREISMLHSSYAWGTVAVILISTLFLLTFGGENWHYLALFFLLIPLTSAILFIGTRFPKMETPGKISGAMQYFRGKWLWISIAAIFLGGCAEVVMAQWSSSYLEQALGIPKVWGDIFGVALFAFALGTGRTLYAKRGKNIGKVLTLGAICATACYLICALSPFPVIGLLACAFTGFCTSMLWPGNLVVASERFPTSGVFIFAVMAASGDLGASVGPQLIGIITDAAIASPEICQLAVAWQTTPAQLGMKIGMLIGAIFPLLAIFVYRYIWKHPVNSEK